MFDVHPSIPSIPFALASQRPYRHAAPQNTVHVIAHNSPEAVPVGIDNRSVRENINFHDIFLDGHRIFKLALAVDEFPKPRHHEICNLDLSFTFRRENTDSIACFTGIFRNALPYAWHRSLKDRVDENTEAVAVHCQDYLARFRWRIKLDLRLPYATS